VTFAGTDGTASPSVQTTKCYTPPDRARRQPAPLPRLQIRLQCLCKMRCCPNMAARQVPRDVHEDARDMARRRMETKRFSNRGVNASALRCALLISRPTTVSNVCGSEVSPARDEFHLAAIVTPPTASDFRRRIFPTASTPFRPRAKPDLSQQMRTKAEVRQRLRVYESLGCCGSCQRC
jgi:hypothetical protein